MPEKKGFFRPFASLKGKIPKESLPQKETVLPEGEEDIPFEAAMVGVRRLPGREKHWWAPSFKKVFTKSEPPVSFHELLRIRVRDTSEYVEELVHGTQRALFEELHAGRISISRVLNLHRLRVEEAEEAFYFFMREAIVRGEHCVLIIHGRGLSSKGEPVLKNKVQEWLKKGPFRRHIIGFCSARQCDGGAGATYVLLSSQPLKKQRKKRART